MGLHRPPLNITDPINRSLGFLSVSIMWGLILTFFGYIAYQGCSAIANYGFGSLFLSTIFHLSESKVSFWAPFGVTIFLAVVAVIITIPCALKCSIWISFYCPRKYRKAISTLLLILANTPSVILARYIRKYFSVAVHQLLFLQSTLNLVIASLALFCMILPFVIVLFNAALESKNAEVISGELLGLGKNYSIHRIIIPKIKHTIIISITFIIGRALSESIMLSMLLSSENYSQGYGGGFTSFINSQLNSIASLIGENYFSDGSTENVQNLMFLFGGLLLATSLICNFMFLGWIKRDGRRINNTSKSVLRKRISSAISWRLMKLLFAHCEDWEKGTCTTANFIYLSPAKRLNRARKLTRRFFEFFCLAIFLTYASTLLGTIFFEGLTAILSEHNGSDISGNDTLGRAIHNTFMIVFLSIVAAMPLALFCSIYLSEYAKGGRFKKYSLSLINAASATPSIIFGIFGLFIFIQKLGWTASGTQGKSLLAGILTMILFILPYLTQLFYTHISDIHKSYREASYILGISKGTTFWRVIAPLAFGNLVFSVLLTTGKIIGETAPLYLTAGINSSPGSLFMYQGQTLTTRIYSQLYETNLTKGERIMNETSFYCLLFISIVVLLAKYANRLLDGDNWKKLIKKYRYALY